MAKFVYALMLHRFAQCFCIRICVQPGFSLDDFIASTPLAPAPDFQARGLFMPNLCPKPKRPPMRILYERTSHPDRGLQSFATKARIRG
jgi:hypothetical protein